MQSTYSKGGGWPLHLIRGTDLVAANITDTTTYTVPAGKAFVMCGLALSSGSGGGQDTIKADGVVFWGVGLTSSTYTVVSDQWRLRPNQSSNNVIIGDNWTGSSSTATTITSTPSGVASGSNNIAIVRAPWLRVWAPGTVLSTVSGASASISGYLVPVNLL